MIISCVVLAVYRLAIPKREEPFVRTMFIAMAGAIVLAGGTLLEGRSYASDVEITSDTPVCYKVLRKRGRGSEDSWYGGGYRGERDDHERLNLDIKFHSFLFGDRQPVYDVQGKHVTAEFSKRRGLSIDMETADGTLITNASEHDHIDKGARLGVETHGVLRGANTLTFDCTWPQNEITPNLWFCKIRADGDKRVTPAVLEKVSDGFCDVFRDSKWGQ